jgi:hypothetical protein
LLWMDSGKDSAASERWSELGIRICVKIFVIELFIGLAKLFNLYKFAQILSGRQLTCQNLLQSWLTITIS